MLEIESPLTIAHLRQRIRDLGHISDTSFNSAIVRMPLDAVTDLMLDLIPENNHDDIRQAMIAAGAPDKSFKAILKGALKKLGSKVIGDTADQVAEGVIDHASEFISPILESATDIVRDRWGDIIGDADDN